MPIIKLSELKEKEIIPGFKARFVHSKHMTIAYWDIEAGSFLPEHSHLHEQTSQVLKGKFEMTLEGKKHQLGPGQIAVIPSHVIHAGKAITDCKIMDVFHPRRDDY